MEKLFSYGTLQDEAVQLATFGRRPDGNRDSLVGYRLTTIPIDNPNHAIDGTTHYRNIQFTGSDSDVVEGIVLSVNAEEFQQVDDYERDAKYERVVVELSSGAKAWVYLRR